MDKTRPQPTDLHDPGRGPEHLRLLVLLLPLGPLHPLGQVVLGIAEPLYEDDRHRPDNVFNVLSPLRLSILLCLIQTIMVEMC